MFFSCSEAKARKAVTYNYACMLVLLVVQTSNELRMMEQYAAPLLSIAKADDTNAKLQGTYTSILLCTTFFCVSGLLKFWSLYFRA